jgi:hypothetical protein
VRQDALAKLVLAIVLLPPRTLLSENPPPLSSAQEGCVYTGGKYPTIHGRQVMSGELHAEYQIPTQSSGLLVTHSRAVGAHSLRSACTGSSLAARQAGKKHAPIDARIVTANATAKASGSRGLT